MRYMVISDRGKAERRRIVCRDVCPRVEVSFLDMNAMNSMNI